MSLSPPALLLEAERVDLIRVWKARRWMAVYRDGIEQAAFPVALGFAPQGHKREQEGDGRTPEGEYIISGRNPRSRFHLSLRVSYPGPDDARQARERGVDPGGDIMVHGTPPGREGDPTRPPPSRCWTRHAARARRRLDAGLHRRVKRVCRVAVAARGHWHAHRDRAVILFAAARRAVSR